MADIVYRNDTRVEPVVQGMINLLGKSLVAHTKFAEDAHTGDTRIFVGNTFRFEKGEQVLIRDNNSVWDDEANIRTGLEFHTIAQDITDSGHIVLAEPLQQDFLVSNNARLQKTIKNIPLYPEDIYYGDQEVVVWDYVAICIEPESMAPEWYAVGGMLSTEYKMSIMVYVRMGSTNDTKNLAARVCHAYADAIHRLLIGNIHVDLDIQDVPLLADANIGDDFVYVSQDVASAWPVDNNPFYEVQDNFSHEGHMRIVPYPADTSSSSSTSSGSAAWSSGSSSSSRSSLSLSSSSSSHHSASSQSSLSSLSSSSESSQSLDTSSSSESSQSSLQNPQGVKIWLNRPLRYHYRVGDKAVLRRRQRYMYDSRVTDIAYGNMQKGEILKAAKLSWFGKETQMVNLMGNGKGGSSY